MYLRHTRNTFDGNIVMRTSEELTIVKGEGGGEGLQLYYVNCWGKDNVHEKIK